MTAEYVHRIEGETIRKPSPLLVVDVAGVNDLAERLAAMTPTDPQRAEVVADINRRICRAVAALTGHA